MDGIVRGLFLLAAFIGGFASGLAGFAMGFIVSAIWLHIITPVQTTTLVVGYSLWTQGYSVWKLRLSLSWRTVASFIIGSTIGVPIGTVLLTYIDPAYMRSGVGFLQIVYGIYGLAQPALKPIQAGVGADGGIRFLNGILCGLTGLPGFIITVWCQLRGWTKDVQRAVFQPVMLAASVVTGISLSVTGTGAVHTWRLPRSWRLELVRCLVLSLGADMRRREFLGVLCGAAAARALVGSAQEKFPVIGLFGSASPAPWRIFFAPSSKA